LIEILSRISKRAVKIFVILVLSVLASSMVSYIIAAMNRDLQGSIYNELYVYHFYRDPKVLAVFNNKSIPAYERWHLAKRLAEMLAERDLSSINSSIFNATRYAIKRALEILRFDLMLFDVSKAFSALKYSSIVIVVMLTSMTFSGLLLGAISARKPNGILSKIIMTLNAVASSVPIWWLAIIVIYILIIRGVVSIGPFFNPNVLTSKIILEKLGIMALVSAILGSMPLAYTTRAIVLGEQSKPYIETLRAVGLNDRRIARKTIRSALPGVFSNMMSMTSDLMIYLLGLEVTLSYPGIGLLIASSFIVRIVEVGGDNVLQVQFFPEMFVVGAYLFAIIYALMDVFFELLLTLTTPYDETYVSGGI